MAKEERKRRSNLTKIETGPQNISFAFQKEILTRPQYAKAGTLAELRVVKNDPTVSLARRLLVSAVQAGSWNIEGEEDVPEEMIEFMEHVLKLRDGYIYNSIAFGQVDYGWMGFEKIFKVDENSRIIIDSLKPLLHDITTILVTEQGKFNGYRQRPLTGMAVDVKVQKCLHTQFAVEAGNLYGVPLLEAIRATSDSWFECNAGAKRYDNKVAGSHWVIYYPPGTSVIDGVSTDNGEVAGLVLAAMQSSGSVAVPTTSVTVLQEILNKPIADLYAWRVELVDDKAGKQSSFADRLNYLDKQKVRGLGLPERAILEGSFGTKAEAGEHGNWALLNLEATDKNLVVMFNEQVIDQLVELNFGSQWVDKIKLIALPLVDTQVEFLRKLYLDIQDPNLDVEKLAGRLDLPQTEDRNILSEKSVEGNDDEG